MVTSKQNHENRGGAQRNSKSGVRGVSWHSRKKCWRAEVGHNGKHIDVGLFDTIEEADAAVRPSAASCSPTTTWTGRSRHEVDIGGARLPRAARA